MTKAKTTKRAPKVAQPVRTQAKPRGKLARLAQRITEPSTMAGLSAIAMLAGAPQGVPEIAMQGIAGLLAALAVLMPERGNPERGD